MKLLRINTLLECSVQSVIVMGMNSRLLVMLKTAIQAFGFRQGQSLKIVPFFPTLSTIKSVSVLLSACWGGWCCLSIRLLHCWRFGVCISLERLGAAMYASEECLVASSVVRFHTDKGVSRATSCSLTNTFSELRIDHHVDELQFAKRRHNLLRIRFFCGLV